MRFAGHPVHPMLVHFPIVLWIGVVAMDIGGWVTEKPIFWTIGLGSLSLGLLTGALAMLAGFLDYAALPKQHPAQKTAVTHMLVMSTAWLMFAVSLALRGFPPRMPPSIWATVISIAACAVLIFGGWLGGRLVYRFGVAVR